MEYYIDNIPRLVNCFIGDGHDMVEMEINVNMRWSLTLASMEGAILLSVDFFHFQNYFINPKSSVTLPSMEGAILLSVDTLHFNNYFINPKP